MSKGKISIWLICTAVLFCFSTCKKYDEDPFFSLRTANARMYGKWKIKTIEIDKVDCTNTFLNSADGYCISVWTFGKGSQFPGKDGMISYPNCSNDSIVEWYLYSTNFKSSRNTTLHFRGTKYGIYPHWKVIGNFAIYVEWTILRLYNKTLIIQGTFANETYVVTFKKIN